MAKEDDGIAGKVAIVTGGGAKEDGVGNGRAACILLARSGVKVVVVDLDESLAEQTVQMIRDEGGEAMAYAADVTSESACKAIVDAATDAYGGVDLLDNNVGIGSKGSVVDENLEQWDRVMRVNVQSMFLMSKYAVPSMRARGGGAIVNVSSISALRPKGLTAYSTSKGAVIALSRAMAVDHAAEGVRVNCIAPGPVYTPMVYSRGMSSEMRGKRQAASPLGIEGSGWDIGNAVTFLLSEKARYITGQTLVVDGGVTIRAAER
ncbi:MAG: SDR family oxidoreductase [Alphaproteobacteria bacterium]|mgnify:FL=1|jgi:NAD(P)-dependent dehydrogenase (short-subunit alcohol dehydrogenase family)|nr:SDR family oxidoreductase [Alphaproteobacteria bacterium]